MKILEEFVKSFSNKLYNSKGERIFATLVLTLDYDSKDLVRIVQDAPENADGYILLSKNRKFVVKFYQL